MLSHFSVFCLVASGKDKGSYTFEKQSIIEHISLYKHIFSALFHANLEVVFSIRQGYKDAEGLVSRLVQNLNERLPDVVTSVNLTRVDNQYYKGLQFTVVTTINGKIHHIGDGGFVDWSQQMLGNTKERMLISAIGLDRLFL
jgi:histidyl-tRNA synthetase